MSEQFLQYNKVKGAFNPVLISFFFTKLLTNKLPRENIFLILVFLQSKQ